jgi:AAA+ ATPase superfamily predicted ATPase
MIGRKQELEQLENLYNREKFEFFVLYGRRRVGKTTILQEFAAHHKVIFYSAQEKNDSLNLHDFSECIQQYFDDRFIASFLSWEKALAYLTEKTAKARRRTVLIIDEFPFMAVQNPSIKSIFQHEIDGHWKNQNIMLIFCGSSVSFMLNDIMGYQSPLFGRTTGSMEILPFDYLDSAAFFPAYTEEEKLTAYGILGGIPRYLNAFSDTETIEKNIEKQILENGSLLNDEPNILLRMELREPAVYNSILEAVARGHNKISEIADSIHEDRNKCNKYISVLLTLRLLEKQVPCGDPENSRKTIYVLTDPFCRFWYRYVFANRSYFEMLGPEAAAREIMQDIPEFMGLAFEDICRQYLVRRAKAGKLPFVPAKIGRWWGNNPALRAQDDVDLLAWSRNGTEAIFCECKFTSKPMPMEEYDDLLTATAAFPAVQKKHLIFISKSGYTASVRRRAIKEGTELLTVRDLFQL